MSSTTYTPYTYLLGWTQQNKWYYGVQYSNNKQSKAHPDNLWKTYFTSSVKVKTFVEQFGIPDVIKIRKTFSTREEAQNWESKVLRRLKVRTNPKWLNVNPGGYGFACPTGTEHPCFGKKKTKASIEKQKQTRKERHNLGLYSYNNHSEAQLESVRLVGKANAKEYTLLNENGTSITVMGLKPWCEKMGLNYVSFFVSVKKGRCYKGWTLKT